MLRVLQLNRLAVRMQRNKQQGYFLLDVLIAASLVVFMAASFTASITPLREHYYKLQLRCAAQMLAADLRQLQQQSLFLADGSEVSLRVSNNDAASYTVYKAAKMERRQSFISMGCAEIYFAQKINKVAFSRTGNPSISGAYVLKHRQLADFACRLSLQPVTGRVTIYEE